MKHIHHIIPKHMGGTDDSSNLVELTVQQHAEAHCELFLLYGREEDYIAWRGLAGIIGHEQAVYEQICLAAKKGGEVARQILKGKPGPKQSEKTVAKRMATFRTRGYNPANHLPKNTREGALKAIETKKVNGTYGAMISNLQPGYWKGKKRTSMNGNQFASKPWITNGIESRKLNSNETIPSGWRFGRTISWRCR